MCPGNAVKMWSGSESGTNASTEFEKGLQRASRSALSLGKLDKMRASMLIGVVIKVSGVAK